MRTLLRREKWLGEPSQPYRDHHKKWQKFAYSILNGLRRRGIVQEPMRYDCVICGDIARVWEHRDYSDPFAIYPACQSCNIKQGFAKTPLTDPPVPSEFRPYSLMLKLSPAIDSPYLPEYSRTVRVAIGLNYPIVRESVFPHNVSQV